MRALWQNVERYLISVNWRSLYQFLTYPVRWLLLRVQGFLREYPIPKTWSFYLFVAIVLYAVYYGREQATVISAFQMPPEHNGQSLPFSGETVANVLRDAITTIQQEAANRAVPPPCDVRADEEPIGCVGEVSWSTVSYERPSPFNVEVKGLSVKGLISEAREVLGRERVISGDLVLVSRDSFQLMARADDGSGPWSVEVQEVSLSGLKKASCALAEKILRETDRHILAMAFFRRGKYADVISLYNAQHGVEGDAATANNLGLAFVMLGRNRDGLTMLRRAVALKPRSAQTRSNLGNALGHAGLQDEAISECKKAIKLKPNLPDAHLCLGYALSMERRWAEAITEDKTATELAPTCPNTHIYLGTALGVEGRHDEADVELKKAIELRPNSADVHTGVGTALQLAGRRQEAITEFKKAIDLQPDFLRAHTELGAALILTKQWDAAISECRKALEIRPDSASAHRCLASALMQREPDLMVSPAREEVTSELRKAIELNPELAETHTELGTILLFFSPGRNEAEGMAQLRKAVEINPWSEEAHYGLGFALKQQGKWDEAIAEFDKAIELQPDYPQARNELAEAVALKNRPKP